MVPLLMAVEATTDRAAEADPAMMSFGKPPKTR